MFCILSCVPDPSQTAFFLGWIYIIHDADVLFQASYGVVDAEFAISKLAQTTMRSELGKIPLDTIFKERESLNEAIVGECWCHVLVELVSEGLSKDTQVRRSLTLDFAMGFL